MNISRENAFELLKVARKVRDRLQHAINTGHDYSERSAQELVDVTRLIAACEAQLAPVPSGMFDKNGNVR